MKYFLCLVMFSWAILARAAEPSNDVLFSCLSGSAVSSLVRVEPIPTDRINEEDGYKSGYDANFFEFRGKDIGYATKGDSEAIIYGGKLYLIKDAQIIADREVALSPININLSDWLLVHVKGSDFLCVSDNFEGLGRSGSFQKVRYGYLLSLDKSKKLYFTVNNVDNFGK